MNLANNYAQHDEDKFYSLAPHPPNFVGMPAPYPLPPQLAHSTARPTSEMYSFHLPGLSVLLVLAWLIGSWFQLWWPATVIFMCMIAALVAVNVFLFAHQLTRKVWIAWAVWLPIAFTNPVMSYAYLIFTELTAGLLLIYAVRRLAMGWQANGPLCLLLISACIAYMPWLAWRCVIISIPVTTYGFIQWWRYWRILQQERKDAQAPIQVQVAPGIGELSASTVPEPLITRPLHAIAPSKRMNNRSSWWLGLFAFPLVVSGVLIVVWNEFLFRLPFPESKVPELGDSSPFLWPWQGIIGLTRFVTQIWALLFDRQMGLLTYAPFYLLAFVGMIVMFRSVRKADRKLLLALGFISLPYIALIAAFTYWNGLWCPPARYLTTFAPLLPAPLAMSLLALSRSYVYKIIYALLVLPSLFLMYYMLYDARQIWPGNPVFSWLITAPDSPLKLDLRNVLPIFSPMDEIRLPANTAWETIAVVGILLFCYWLMVWQRGPRIWRARRLPYALHGLAWLIVIAVVSSGWYVMNSEFIKHKTTLTEVHRWPISPTPIQPLGLAYLNGKVFVADFRAGTLGAVDTSTGVYTPVTPKSAQGVLNYKKPGEVKVGPDGLLYVLNNGEGTQALYVMQPDGTVVRQEALNGKTEIAVGLSFGSDGKMYIGDMVGGKVIKYDPSGVDPLAAWGNSTGGFNNVAGVALDSKGRIYAAETGTSLVYQFTPDGKTIRTFNVGCQPWYMVAKGDWLETTCNKGLVSINLKSEYVQGYTTSDNNKFLTNPTGILYAPDGTLYIMDVDTLIAYQIEH